MNKSKANSIKNNVKPLNKLLARLAALNLAVCACFTLTFPAFAAEISASGDSASIPISLSSVAGGESGDTPAATAMHVTIPTALPMSMSQDGEVSTANNCQIVNQSYGAVRVKSIDITAESGWKLTAFGDKSTLAAEKVDSNKLGFSVTVGGTTGSTDSSNATTQTLIDAPAGCAMTGVSNTSGNSVDISYSAIVTPLSGAVTDTTIASVVIIVEWDTAA